jgi:superfamily II DNA or RNA helicase
MMEKRRQPEAYQAMMKRLVDNKKQTGYLSLPPGGGKTTMAYKMGSDMGRAMGVIVTKDFLLNQWTKRGNTFVPGIKIGVVQGQDIVYKDCDVIIFMLQTMLGHMEDPVLMDALSCCGTMVLDESRHVNAAQFSKILPLITSKHIIALDGTPHRDDGMDMVLQHWIGPVTFQCEREYNFKVRVEVLHEPYEHVKESFTVIGKHNIAKMTTELSLKEVRNEAILNKIVQLIPSDRQMLILGERVAHLTELMEKLEELVPDASIGHFYSGISKNEYEMSEVESKQIIFATYKMAEEALDIPTLSVLFHLSPKKDVKQCVGRVMRGVVAHDPLIYEFYDYYTLWAGFFEVRHTFYRNEGYEIAFHSKELAEKHRTRGTTLKEEDGLWILKKDVSKKKTTGTRKTTKSLKKRMAEDPVSMKHTFKKDKEQDGDSNDGDSNHRVEPQKKRQCKF